jgi:amidase
VIVTLTATELARRIRERELSSVQVVRAFAGMIVRHNDDYNAIVLLDLEAALERAREADHARERGEIWGPLHGVPITVKDTLATRGVRTTAGASDLATYIPDADAVAVSLLRRAGAIVFAKTNTATLAMDMQTTNVLFGTTNNPWNVTLTTGGSSGGCAAAVASHMSPLSFGSDLAGSIRLPAAYTGIWGLRPTHGVVSMRGHIPPRPGEVDGIRTMAVLGPLANSVEDLKLALSVLAQSSPEDETVAPLRPRTAGPVPVASLKIAYMDELGGIPVSAEVKAAIHKLGDALRSAGATVVKAEPRDFSYQRAWETWGALVGMQGGYERSNLARHIGRLFAQKSVEDIPHQRRILDPISVEAHMRALTEQAEQTNALERFLSGYDTWIVPVSSLPAFEHHPHNRTFGIFNVYDDPLRVDGTAVPYYNVTQSYTTLFSVTEGPVVSMPASQTAQGLPIGLQLVGRRHDDWHLLAVARAMEPMLARLRPNRGTAKAAALGALASE